MQRRGLFIAAFILLVGIAFSGGNELRRALDPEADESPNQTSLKLGQSIKELIRARLGVDAADPSDLKLVRRGRAVYADHCASCHGADLEGQPNWRQRNADGTFPAPPHDETGHTWHHPDQLLFDYTKKGGQALAPAGYKSAMPGFGELLHDSDIWAVLSYIQSRWPAEVLERQKQLKYRTGPTERNGGRGAD